MPVPGSENFNFLARLLHRRSGLLLTAEKAGLIDRRLTPVMRRFGLKDFAALTDALRHGHDALADAVVEAMTVNETFFFRDPAQFDALRALLPPLLAAREEARRLRIWSAACAAGQEAWSIAMLLEEMNLSGWTVDLIATDLSGAMLERAMRGHYSPFEVQRGLSLDLLSRHFIADSDGGFTVSDRLKRMVSFRRFNLLDSFGWLDEIDIVFCRNVLIYFDRATKLSIMDRMAAALAEDGLLLLGDAEQGQAFAELCEVRGGIYARRMMRARAIA
jgi:chemotaxis protein methyltransferase CheR